MKDITTWMEDVAIELRRDPIIANYQAQLQEFGTPIEPNFRVTHGSYVPALDAWEANLLLYVALHDDAEDVSFITASGHKFAIYGIRVRVFGIEVAIAPRDMLRQMVQQRIANAYIELMQSVTGREGKFLLLPGCQVRLATQTGGVDVGDEAEEVEEECDDNE